MIYLFIPLTMYFVKYFYNILIYKLIYKYKQNILFTFVTKQNQ